jgi:hypothetical protein
MNRMPADSQAAAVAKSPRPWKRADSVLGILSLWLGVAPVVLMGSQWLLVWAIQGHRPVMWIDDPGGFGGFMNAFGVCTGISLLLLPAIWPWFAIYWLVRHGRSRPGKVMALANFVLPVASFFILRADPLGIASWWFD